MKKHANRMAIVAIAATLALCSLRVNAQENTPVVKCEIRVDRDRQAIHGFGACVAWTERRLFAEEDFSKEVREGILDILFDPEKGIGLDIVAIMVMSGPDHEGAANEPHPGYMTAPGVYDLSLIHI